MRFHSSGFLLLASLVTVTAHADQTCRSNLEESTPSSRFVFNENGTVTDTETEITWMRCAMGQTWDGKTCSGKAQAYSWQDARDAVAELNSDTFGEPTSWRLPYVPELASIVERKCFEPRVNLSVFPATPSTAFWTGMKKKGSAEQAYTIDFGQGAVTPSNKTSTGAVRLMHDGPHGKWWKMKDIADKKP
jgi:hypothetical protein